MIATGRGWEVRLGDCRDMLPGLTGISAVITDPPYGISLSNHGIGHPKRRNGDYTISGDESQEIGLQALLLCAAWPVVTFASPMKPWPGEWRQFLVWSKGGAVGGGGDIATCWKLDWELIQVARTGRLNGERDSAVLYFPATPQMFSEHPAAKPVALMKYLVEKVTQPGDLVLDPFAGSATTGVACIKTGRRFLGVEIDPGYFDIAVKRLREAEMQLSLFPSEAL